MDGKPAIGSRHRVLRECRSRHRRIVEVSFLHLEAVGDPRDNVASPTHDVSAIAQRYHRTISMLGAIIVIASSAIGPFSQQASATSACEGLLAGKTAKVFVADVIEASMPSQMRGIAMKGFMYGASDNLVATPGLFECYTGDCDFKPHKSLALCNSCMHQGNCEVGKC